MKQSHQLIAVAVLGIGTYLILKNSSATGGILRPIATQYPNGTMSPQPVPGTPAYAAWLAQQQQAQLDMAKLGTLNNLGRMVNGWFAGSGSYGSAGNMTGPVRPSTDYGMGTYTPPDSFAVNPPQQITYFVPGTDTSGTTSSADAAALYSNDGYGFYTQ